MARSRLGLKVVGACALVLGLMALVAGGAQAEVGAAWTIINSPLGALVKIPAESLLPLMEIKEVENKTLSFLFTTKSGTKVAILCTAVKFDEGGLLVAEGGISLSRLQFTGCSVFLNEKAAPSCEAHSTGKTVGELLTEKFKGLIVLDVVIAVSEDYVKFVPDEGSTFIKIELGEECAIGTLVKIEAKALGEGLWLKDGGGNASFKEEQVEHLFVEALHGLIALGQPLVMDGSMLIRLVFGDFGLKWGGTPG
jgi:hypothetical protein